MFKLRAPANAIAGFGYFASFSVLPDWLAWDTFGEANGVASLAELRTRLHRIREGASIEADPQGRIGCSLIAEATFFARKNWVAAPSDWKPRTQTGASVDLTVGEGLRVWSECLARVPQPAAPETAPQGPRYGTPVMHRPRLGQGIFRVQVLDAPLCQRHLRQSHPDIFVPMGGEWSPTRAQAIPRSRSNRRPREGRPRTA